MNRHALDALTEVRAEVFLVSCHQETGLRLDGGKEYRHVFRREHHRGR